jgi:phosphotransferase system enzyme I (PtsI)
MPWSTKSTACSKALPMGPKEAPHELAALLDVHLMLLQDEELISGVKHWITDRLYNAEWALTTQLEVIARQFDEMEDEYLRERKADLEQVVERILRHMKGVASPVAPPPSQRARARPAAGPAAGRHSGRAAGAGGARPVAGRHAAVQAKRVCRLRDRRGRQDLAHRHRGAQHGHPRRGGRARASQLVRQDDWVIIDGDAGVVIVDPSPIILAEYGFKQRQGELERTAWPACAHARRHAGRPEGRAAGQHRNARGRPRGRQRRRRRRGPVPQRIPVHGPPGQPARRRRAVPGLPRAVEGMQGLPVTIRTIDVGADKPLDNNERKTTPT